jgi:hypothetical protein
MVEQAIFFGGGKGGLEGVCERLPSPFHREGHCCSGAGASSRECTTVAAQTLASCSLPPAASSATLPLPSFPLPPKSLQEIAALLVSMAPNHLWQQQQQQLRANQLAAPALTHDISMSGASHRPRPRTPCGQAWFHPRWEFPSSFAPPPRAPRANRQGSRHRVGRLHLCRGDKQV